MFLNKLFIFEYSDWSQDGVITRIISDTVVECISTHLTSFAVLVDHQGVLQEDLVYYYILLKYS